MGGQINKTDLETAHYFHGSFVSPWYQTLGVRVVVTSLTPGRVLEFLRIEVN